MPSQLPAIYLDYNATAPLHPAARERMLASWQAVPGNPSSPHRFGQAARDALENARAGLAGLLGWNRRELFFMSGGTEGNNLLLRWVTEAHPPVHVITSRIEHPSVLRSVEWLGARGIAVDYLPVDRNGVVQVERIDDLLRPETRIVSVMAANNETGTVQPLQALAARIRAWEAEHIGDRSVADRILIHTDAVQSTGRIRQDLRSWDIDAVTVAAHKLGGPRGIGAVALREGRTVPPLLLGGRQERDRRAGTESVALAEGFHAAADAAFDAFDSLNARIGALRDRLESQLGDTQDFFRNGADTARLPNTANLGFAGVSAQALLVALDLRGIAVSTGSACSSGAIEPSHVLAAMGVPTERLTASLRISLGYATTEAEIDRCADVMLEEVKRLRGRRAAS